MEEGRAPTVKAEDPWTQPIRWSDEYDDDAIDDEMREEPYIWGEH
jgi:hypothetical protein